MVAAVTMVRDEADVIEGTLRAMAREVDLVLVADNGSTDETPVILSALARELPIEILEDPDPAYYQARKMTALAAEASRRGASWVVPFDADERWYSPFGPIGRVLGDLPDDVSLAPAVLYDHVATGLDPDGPPIERMAWRRRDPAPLPKVAARARPAVRIHQGNHGADFGGPVPGLLAVRHFPYRSAEQFVSKVRNGAAAYRATDLPADQGTHWRQYGAILDASGPEVLIAEVFRRWFWVADPTQDETLIRDPAP
jgi:hypothetical protein